MPGFAAQTGAPAIRAWLGAEQFAQLFAHALGFRLAVASFQVGDDALKRVGAFDDIAAVVEVAEVDILAAAAEQDNFLLAGAELFEGHFQAEVVMGGQRAEHLEVIDVAPVPAAHGALGQGQLTVDQALDVKELLDPQAVARGAGAGGVVEGKQLGFQLAD